MNPDTARPPAIVTLCSSAIPQSKNLAGYFIWKLSSPVPSVIAAEIATIFGFLAASSVIVFANTVV